MTNVYIDPAVIRASVSESDPDRKRPAGPAAEDFVLSENHRLQAEVQALRKNLAIAKRAREQAESDSDHMQRNRVCMRGILHNELERASSLKLANELYSESIRAARSGLRLMGLRALMSATLMCAALSPAVDRLAASAPFQPQIVSLGLPPVPLADAIRITAYILALSWAVWGLAAGADCRSVAAMLCVETSPEMLAIKRRISETAAANSHLHELVDNL